MGRVASASDNAAMESWHALLQKNVLDRRRWRTRDELHAAVVFCIEHTYNRRRRQRALGELTPVEYELAFTTQAAVAARSVPTTVNRSCSSRLVRPRRLAAQRRGEQQTDQARTPGARTPQPCRSSASR